MAETVSQMEKVRNMMQRFIAVAALIALFIVFSLVTDRFLLFRIFSQLPFKPVLWPLWV